MHELMLTDMHLHFKNRCCRQQNEKVSAYFWFSYYEATASCFDMHVFFFWKKV